MAGRLRPLGLGKLSGGASPVAFGAGRSIESFGGGAGKEAYGAGRIAPRIAADKGPGEIFGTLAEVGQTAFATMLKADEADRAAKRRDDILAGRRLALQAGVEWDKRLLDAKQAAPADAKDFTKSVTTAFKEYSEKTLAGLEGEQKQLVADEFLQLGGTLQREATNFESERRFKAREQDAKASIEIAQNAIFARPQDHGRILGGLLNDIAESDLPEFAKQELAQSTTAALAGSLWLARAERDPYAARDLLLSAGPEELQGLEFKDRQTILNKAEANINGIEVEQRRAASEAKAEARERAAIVRQAQAEAKADARLVAEDALAAAGRGEDLPGAQKQILEAFGPKDAAKYLGRINREREVAGLKTQFGSMSQQEIVAAVNTLDPSGANYAVEAKTQEDAARAGAAALKARQDALKPLLEDEIAARQQGKSTGPEVYEQLGQIYPPEQAAAIAGQLDEMGQTAGIVAGFAGQSPGEIADQLQAMAASGRDFKQESEVYAQAVEAAQKVQKQRIEKPAEAVAAASPAIAAGLNSKDPQERAAALRKSWDMQGETFGLPPDKRRLLTPDAVKSIVDQVKAAPTVDARRDILASLSVSLGDDVIGDQVLTELEAGGMPAEARFAMEQLQQGNRLGSERILGQLTVDPAKLPKLGDATDKDVKLAVDALMASDGPSSITASLATLTQEPGLRARSEAERSSLQSLALGYAADGDDASTAALKAQRDLFGDKVVVGNNELGKVRVPAGTDQDALLAGLEVARSTADLSALAPPVPTAGSPGEQAQMVEFNRRDFEREAEVVRNDGIWTESQGGYTLLHPATGKIVAYYTLEQLLAAASDRDAAERLKMQGAGDAGLVAPGVAPLSSEDDMADLEGIVEFSRVAGRDYQAVGRKSENVVDLRKETGEIEDVETVAEGEVVFRKYAVASGYTNDQVDRVIKRIEKEYPEQPDRIEVYLQAALQFLNKVKNPSATEQRELPRGLEP